MPLIAKIRGFKLYFSAGDSGEPIHVHVRYQGGMAKFWVNPTRLAYNRGLNRAEIAKAENIVIEYQEFIVEKWNEFFSR